MKPVMGVNAHEVSIWVCLGQDLVVGEHTEYEELSIRSKP